MTVDGVRGPKSPQPPAGGQKAGTARPDGWVGDAQPTPAGAGEGQSVPVARTANLLGVSDPLALAPTLDDVKKAAERIRFLFPDFAGTPLVPSSNPQYPGIGPNDSFSFKREDETPTRAFKFRGAVNAVMAAYDRGEREFVVASSGSHALGVAYAAAELRKRFPDVADQIKVKVYVPEGTAPEKIEAPKEYGAIVEELKGVTDLGDVNKRAREDASSQGLHYINGQADPDVIAGAATVGLELYEQIKAENGGTVPRNLLLLIGTGAGGLPAAVVHVMVALLERDGGLISTGKVNVTVATPQSGMAGMLPALRGGEPVGPVPTLAVAGAVANPPPGIVAIHKHYDAEDFNGNRILCPFVVPEPDIADGMKRHWEDEGVRVEGAAALALAPFAVKTATKEHRQKHGLSDSDPVSVVAIITGGVIAPATFDKDVGSYFPGFTSAAA